MVAIRVGVIGQRFGAQVHAPAFQNDSRCIVTAVVGRDWQTLIHDPGIDAVSIAVPPLDQPAIIVAAASAGKHVFCEKPLAATLADAERAVECVRRAGVAHAIDFIFPEIPAWQRTRDLLRAGAIGAPRHFSYTWKVQTFASRTNAGSWKNRHADGGGAVGNFLPHVIFNIESLLGKLSGIEMLSRRDRTGASAFCDAVVHLEDGVHGQISIATDAYLGSGHTLEIYGDAGTVVLKNPTPDYADGFELSVGTPDSNGLAVVYRDPPAGDVDGRIAPVNRIVRRFIDQIEGGGCVRPNLEDGLRMQHWLQRLTDADSR